MRILYHHRTQGRGAEGNHITSIVTALRAIGHEVDVVSPPGVDPFDPAATMPVDKTRVRTTGWSALWTVISRSLPNWLFELSEIAYNIPAYARLQKMLAERRYDIVYERYAFYLLAGAIAARRAGCRFVLEVNEVSGIPDRARRQSFQRLCAWFERRLLPRCELVHAVSSYLGDRLLEHGVESGRLVVVPNGFDVSRVQPRKTREEVRRLLKLGTEPVIGFAGWFDHWDRLDFLADVFTAIRRGGRDLRLCLVGDGPGGDDARRRLRSTDFSRDVIFTGPVPRSEVYDYLQVFDIGILPHSNQFGSPIVMFEMMGLGVPLVVPRLAPIMDVHLPNETALVFEPLNLAECVERILALLDSPELRRTVAASASRRLIERHSWTETARRILAALPG